MPKASTATTLTATTETTDVQLINLANRLNIYSPGRRLDARSLDFLATLYATDTTIHACRVLFHNLEAIPALIDLARPGKAFGDTKSEGATARASAALVRVAERFEAGRVKFTTYARPRMVGVGKDFCRSHQSHPMVSLDATSDRDSVLRDAIPIGDEFFGSYAPLGQKSVIPVPSDDWAAEWLVANELDHRPIALQAIAEAANLTKREWVILQNEKSGLEKWKDLARGLGLSEQAMSVARVRLIKKIQKHVK